MSLFVTPDGEIVRLGTGEVLGLDSKYYFEQTPPLSKDADTLMRHWSGMSAEPLGSIPKTIVISRAEQKLLSKLRPWKWLKYAARMDYLRLLDKLNRHKLSTNMSIRMKIAWGDQNSYYNSPKFRTDISLGIARAWADPNTGYHTQEFRDEKSAHFKAIWADPVYKAKRTAEFLIFNSARAIKGWETRRKNYPMLYKDPEATHDRMCKAQKLCAEARWKKRVELHGPTGVKDPELTSKRKKEAWAWRKLSMVFDMLFRAVP